MKRRQPLLVEALEDRTVPVTFGLPWQSPRHLTLSFPRDGTPLIPHPAAPRSQLYTLLDPQFASSQEWQAEIVRAFQTWAVHGNVSVGLVADSMDPFGVAGRMQGDPRFGDIRLAAHRLAPEVLSISTPPDPFLAGTLAGDVFLNSFYPFGPTNLFPVLLHEAGHVLGLEHSTDPESPMFSHFNERTVLTQGDIDPLQNLYGVRRPDRHEVCDSHGVCTGNETRATATRIEVSGISPSYDGQTPLVVWGDRTTNTDTDYFEMRPFRSDYRGAVTFRLQTAGLSFLAPRLLIEEVDRDNLDRVIRTFGPITSAHPFGDILSITVPNVDRQNFRYFARVDSGVNDLFGVGRYALGVTFDAAANPAYVARLDTVMRGPFDALDREDDIDKLFRMPTTVTFNADLHTNDTLETATVLAGTPGYPRDAHYEAAASLEDAFDVDVYRVTAAQNTTVLTATLLQAPANGVLPTVYVFDAQFNFVLDVRVLLNGNGTFTLQAGNLDDETDYLLLVAAQPYGGLLGNYTLTVDFGNRLAELPEFATGTLSASDPVDEHLLFIGQSQLLQLVLDAGTRWSLESGQVRTEVYDMTGQLVTRLVGPAGLTVSDSSVFLLPGVYYVRFTAESFTGDPPPTLAYRLQGVQLTDPIGPAIENPLFDPLFVCGEDPQFFCFPGGVPTLDPLLWLFLG